MLKDYAASVIGVDSKKFNKAYDFLTKYGYRFSTYFCTTFFFCSRLTCK